MKDIFSLKLDDIAPSSITGSQNVKDIMASLDPQLQEVSRLSLEPLILARIDELPEKVIDLLAWQLHVDFYDLAGTLAMKRNAVKGSILWHMHKGTVWAIKEALHQLDIDAEFVHWHDDNSIPYTFKLDAIVTGDFYRTKGRGKLQASIRRAVEESKAARSWLADLNIKIEFKEDLGLYVGTAKLLSGERRLGLDAPTPPGVTKVYAGIGTGLQGQERIRLAHEEDIDAPVFAGLITLENRDLQLGVDLALMQELLLQFERRILGRIDDYEKTILFNFEERQKELNLQLEEIKDMLRWKGDDEEL